MARAAAPTRSAVRDALARPPDRPCDDELAEMLSRAAHGDTNAYAAFYDATSPLVYGLVLTVVRSESDAERIVGDIYLDIWRNPSVLLTGRLTLLTALLCLTQRRAVEHARGDVRDAGRPGAPATRPMRRTGSRRQRLSLPRSTPPQARQLTPVQQEILVLSYLGGYTVRQVSALLSLPTASVREALTAALLGLAPPGPASLS